MTVCRASNPWPLCKTCFLKRKWAFGVRQGAQEEWYVDHVLLSNNLDLVPTATVVDGEGRVDAEELSTTIGKVLDTLTSREREIIIMRFGLQGEPYTFSECAKIFKVTLERVRQIENRALQKLSHHLRGWRLLPWVPGSGDTRRDDSWMYLE